MVVEFDPRETRNFPDFAASPARSSWPACSGHTAACMHRFFHILGEPGEPAVLVYVKVGSGRFLADEDICGATDHIQRFLNGCGRKRVNESMIYFQTPPPRTW